MELWGAYYPEAACAPLPLPPDQPSTPAPGVEIRGPTRLFTTSSREADNLNTPASVTLCTPGSDRTPRTEESERWLGESGALAIDRHDQLRLLS